MSMFTKRNPDTRLNDYYFKSFNLRRQNEDNSIENYSLTTRASAQLLLHGRNNSSRKEDAEMPHQESFYVE